MAKMKSDRKSLSHEQLVSSVRDAARVEMVGCKDHKSKVTLLVKQIKERKIKTSDPKGVAEFIIAKMSGTASGIRERQRLSLQEVSRRLAADTGANNVMAEAPQAEVQMPAPDTMEEPKCCGQCETEKTEVAQ